MNQSSGELFDTEVNGSEGTSTKSTGAKLRAAAWLIAGVAILGFLWSSISLYDFIQEESVLAQAERHPSVPDRMTLILPDSQPLAASSTPRGGPGEPGWLPLRDFPEPDAGNPRPQDVHDGWRIDMAMYNPSKASISCERMRTLFDSPCP